MKHAHLCGVLGLAVFMGLLASTAQANVISGSLWHVPEAIALDASPANVPVATPDVTFNVNSPLNFDATRATVGTWLGSGGAFSTVENTAGTLASLMDDGIVGTLVEFTGLVTVTTDQVFSVTHDDGLTLIIGGLNLGFNPGPTAPTSSDATYTGPSGTFPFQLVYAECCGGPAVLQVDLPFTNAVPEPSTLALIAGSLAALGFIRRRRRDLLKAVD
jgi:hypothetical protein